MPAGPHECNAGRASTSMPPSALRLATPVADRLTTQQASVAESRWRCIVHPASKRRHGDCARAPRRRVHLRLGPSKQAMRSGIWGVSPMSCASIPAWKAPRAKANSRRQLGTRLGAPPARHAAKQAGARAAECNQPSGQAKSVSSNRPSGRLPQARRPAARPGQSHGDAGRPLGQTLHRWLGTPDAGVLALLQQPGWRIAAHLASSPPPALC